MNVFIDLHHGGLYESLRLLFEKRLNWNLYRPIGMDWFDNGFWKIGDPYPNPRDTAEQFLRTDNKTWDPYKNLNADYSVEDGIYYVYDPVHEVHQKAISFEKFKEMDIDIVISTYEPHDEVYARLIREYKPKAKHIAQMGNIYQTTNVQNVMCSTAPYGVPIGKNVVFYHQEFDLDVFKYVPPIQRDVIRSFVNLHPESGFYDLYKNQLPEYIMESYGAGCPDGTVSGVKNIASKMQSSAFGWMIKPGGDGFGHVIHNWFASGRPVLIKGSQYRDKLAGELLIDGKTCIDLEASSFANTLVRIRYYSQPELHNQMCQNTINRFREIVNFDEEEKKIREFLARII